MKIFYPFITLLISTFAFSQTRLIAFKSHSGHSDNFNIAISENLFDANFSNLGDPPQNFIESKLDSMIILNDKESILVTSSSNRIVFPDQKKKWQQEREVIRNSVLFSKKNIDSVKTVLKINYHFVNDMDSVVVVKYDTISKSYKEIKSGSKPEKEKSEKGRGGLLLGILMLSGASGFYSWKKNKKNNEK
ncbi:hypothetical protein CLU96_0476 [Chryseobacterium sp. 52]|uniref:hypothetical protein n=1 Tax=Chryseobacterium sp. 52 TaxID=2035213 RepID=UPI000C17E9FF|nr:hypothetical protein [Chryseobacterium sp. 52]PIF43567.1 hypothetical protein CLU96_0476 [Chryseobacterium sp. 52]